MYSFVSYKAVILWNSKIATKWHLHFFFSTLAALLTFHGGFLLSWSGIWSSSKSSDNWYIFRILYSSALAEIRCIWNWRTYQLHLTHHDRNSKDIQKSDRQNKALQSLSFVQLLPVQLLVLRQLLLHALPLFSQPQAAFARWLLPTDAVIILTWSNWLVQFSRHHHFCMQRGPFLVQLALCARKQGGTHS